MTPGVALTTMAQLMLGNARPESFDSARLGAWETRKLPHFQQRIKRKRRK